MVSKVSRSRLKLSFLGAGASTVVALKSSGILCLQDYVNNDDDGAVGDSDDDLYRV